MQGADRRIAGLWLALLVFIVYGSWVPLALVPRDIGAAWQAFLALPPPNLVRASRTDLAVNLLLTVPLAFGAAYLLASLPSRAWRWTLGVLLWPALLLLSVGVEFGQMFFPPRQPSWTDVAMQTVGSTLGLAAFAFWREPAQRFVAGLSARLPLTRRLERWLFLYLVLLLGWQMMPMDLTASPVEIYRKWRDGRVLLLPFAMLPAGTWERIYELGTDLLLWLPVGALWWLSAPRRSLGALLWRGVLVVSAVEVAQLFVLSRVSDVTDVLLGSLGVVLGAALARRLRHWRQWPLAQRERLLGLLLLGWALLTVGVLWLPFDFESARWWGEGAGAHWYELATRTPFTTYFGRTEFGALGEILRKLLVFLPGGLLLALRLASGERRPVPPTLVVVLPLAAAALLLELGQLGLPDKVADLTDAALGALGGWLGWRLGLGLLAEPPVEEPPLPAVQSASVPAWRAPSRPHEVAAASWPQQLAVVAALAAAVWLFARLPGVPYNVARLVPAGFEGLLSAAGVALALAWMVMAPAALLPESRRAWRPALPLLLLVHGSLSFLVLRAAVPLPMLHKLIGTPVLGWGALAVLEDLGRYLALHAAVMLPLLGAMWLVRTATAPRALPDLLWWAGWSVLLLLPLHGVVVWGAGTDNLVELMDGGGGLGTSLALASGLGLLALAGVALAAVWGGSGGGSSGGRGAWRRGPLLVLAVLAVLLAPAVWALGLADAVFKYERSFSAAQFLLSAGRDAYATGPALLVRALLALAGSVALVALLQAPAWRALALATTAATAGRTHPHRGRDDAAVAAEAAR